MAVEGELATAPRHRSHPLSMPKAQSLWMPRDQQPPRAKVGALMDSLFSTQGRELRELAPYAQSRLAEDPAVSGLWRVTEKWTSILGSMTLLSCRLRPSGERHIQTEPERGHFI